MTKTIGSWIDRFDHLSLRKKLKALRSGIMVPLIILIVWMVFLMIDYNERYSSIINNVAAATEFNSDFRSDLDYKMYRIVAGAVTFEEAKPYDDVRQTRAGLYKLKKTTTTQNSISRIDAILRLLDRLEQIITDIELDNISPGRSSASEILDKDIYQYTELIDEKLADYIRYEAENAKIVKEELERQIMTSLTSCILITVLLVIVVLAITNRISKGIEQPIREMCDSTKEVAKGNFQIQVAINPMEEMEVLGNSFNSMVKKIGGLVDHMKLEQIHLRKTELKLLQAQINPHFLYNTLDTIIWLAEGGENTEVVKIVDELSTFFRTTLSKGNDFITLEAEESHVRSYLEIQQFRYRDILDYEIYMAPDILSYYILKISLQPIVENALYHGLKNKRGRGKIVVRGYMKEQYLHFSVEDTGRGMTYEELATLMEQIRGNYVTNNQSGFGLFNVNERLCLNYGPECMLHIESEYGAGTKVYFKIPLCETRNAK